MVAKVVLFVCAQAFVMQSIAGNCIGAGWAGAPYYADAPLAAPWGLEAPCGARAYAALPIVPGPAAAAASRGGSLPTASASPIPPSGVALVSENAYEGPLAVAGAVPFLGTVSLEGVLPTAGNAAVRYGCGNGEVAMLTEDFGAAAGPLGYGYGIGPLGYGIEAPLAAPYGYEFGAIGCDAPLAAPFARGYGFGAYY